MSLFVKSDLAKIINFVFNFAHIKLTDVKTFTGTGNFIIFHLKDGRKNRRSFERICFKATFFLHLLATFLAEDMFFLGLFTLFILSQRLTSDGRNGIDSFCIAIFFFVDDRSLGVWNYITFTFLCDKTWWKSAIQI